ncbi:hypothetical protein Purlil1_10290 [Purpureocillium lilacinum]|uniref:Uncharacterized protein n=1 Tax=Purpureocillium lilacinum TaxID=33203 RepID=A0ABR0BPA9_PURLI|nr:hypothetical protein Purlil1_10290 [Purpureocillium lilacinum]
MNYHSLVLLSALTPAAIAAKFLNSKWDVTEGQWFTLRFDGCDVSDSLCLLALWRSPHTTEDFIQAVNPLAGTEQNTSIEVQLVGVPTGTYFFGLEQLKSLVRSPTFLYVSSNDPAGPIPLLANTRLPLTETTSTRTSTGTLSSSDTPTINESTLTASLTTPAPSTAQAPSSTAAAAITATPTEAITTPDGQGSPQLSSGAKAGIAVGCVAAVVIALALAILFWRRRRRRTQALKVQGAYQSGYSQPTLSCAQGPVHVEDGPGGKAQELSGRSPPMSTPLHYRYGSQGPSTDRSDPHTPTQHLSYLSYLSAQSRSEVYEMSVPENQTRNSTIAAALTQSTATDTTTTAPTSQPPAGGADKTSTGTTTPGLLDLALGPAKRISSIEMPWFKYEQQPSAASDDRGGRQQSVSSPELSPPPSVEPPRQQPSPSGSRLSAAQQHLESQYEQLEARRRRILDLESIERQQAELRERMDVLRREEEGG